MIKISDQCDVYNIVELGGDLVQVRCSEVGEHTEHRCVIDMTDNQTVKHKNIFDEAT